MDSAYKFYFFFENLNAIVNFTRCHKRKVRHEKWNSSALCIHKFSSFLLMVLGGAKFVFRFFLYIEYLFIIFFFYKTCFSLNCAPKMAEPHRRKLVQLLQNEYIKLYKGTYYYTASSLPPTLGSCTCARQPIFERWYTATHIGTNLHLLHSLLLTFCFPLTLLLSRFTHCMSVFTKTLCCGIWIICFQH